MFYYLCQDDKALFVLSEFINTAGEGFIVPYIELICFFMPFRFFSSIYFNPPTLFYRREVMDITIKKERRVLRRVGWSILADNKRAMFSLINAWLNTTAVKENPPQSILDETMEVGR